ncbi:helix-turn-helix domain-containing protein [Nocardia sp. CDC153]|uniref:helix-turn-helix domain-containing protein n=1 Tax=Nocardia sp. CDC153 TaxID=3112167 RepID=UPI002DBC1CDC|nr:helix-turn-helix domain-containing protein [Nocardia sp. CDC153]MEC3957545.1 helix-turn-helix domain-containing protein [Nocardia sp. CDC153]
MTGNDAGIADGRTNDVAPVDLPSDPPIDDTSDPSDNGDTAVLHSTPARRFARQRQRRLPRFTGGKAVAWLGFGFGALLSVLANWLYTWLPHASHATAETPSVAAQIGSAVWPLVLMLSVEVLLRVRWLPGIWWRLARYFGIGTVAFGSAIISYGHVYHVLLSWGYDSVGAHVGPLAIDGFIVICGFALLSESVPQHPRDVSQRPGNGNGHNISDPNPESGRDGDTDRDTPDTACNATDTPKDAAGPVRAVDATAGDTTSDLDRDNRIRQMARAGMSTREIGRIVSLHHSTVARIVAHGDTESDARAPLRLIAEPCDGTQQSDLNPLLR